MTQKVNGWIRDGKALNKAIALFVKATEKYHDELDGLSRGALFQALTHKNATPIIALFNALDRSAIHAKGFKSWVETHGKITLSRDKETDEVKVSWSKEYVQTEADASAEKVDKLPKWWKQFKPAPAFKGFDYDAELAKLQAKATEMSRAIDQGTIKVKGEIIELSDEQKAMINLGSFLKVKNYGEVWN